MIYCEYPMLNSTQANHLYEVGSLMILLHIEFGDKLRFVTPSSLKRFLTGKGNAPKSHDPAKCGVGKKPLCVVCGAKALHHIEFDSDPGKDKLHAYGLYALGVAIENGEIEYEPIARRGAGKKAIAKQKTLKRKRDKLSKVLVEYKPTSKRARKPKPKSC